MGNRLSKIYTRTGDKGVTGLGDGSRVDKDSLRVEAYGTVDELNSALGVVIAADLPDEIRDCLTRIQHELFDLGGELCMPGTTLIPDRYVDGDRLSFFNPFDNRLVGEDDSLDTDVPDDWWHDDEFALRLHRQLSGYQFAAYGYHGYWKSPAGFDLGNGDGTFPANPDWASGDQAYNGHLDVMYHRHVDPPVGRPAGAHRVRGVDDEIHQHLLDLIRVCENAKRFHRRGDLQFDFFAALRFPAFAVQICSYRHARAACSAGPLPCVKHYAWGEAPTSA